MRKLFEALPGPLAARVIIAIVLVIVLLILLGFLFDFAGTLLDDGGTIGP
ncbi:MAG: hypothetical protein OEM97_08150 [Acidimicrobiia bacterium]|nr:hypothetical protein [Acidimicrobiia bacterium]